MRGGWGSLAAATTTGAARERSLPVTHGHGPLHADIPTPQQSAVRLTLAVAVSGSLQLRCMVQVQRLRHASLLASRCGSALGSKDTRPVRGRLISYLDSTTAHVVYDGRVETTKTANYCSILLKTHFFLSEHCILAVGCPLIFSSLTHKKIG